jgi:hypothetical protein
VIGYYVHTIVGGSMAKVTYDKKITALLVIDPYNDFLSEGGKLWDRVKGVAEALIGLDHGETVTTPSLPDMADWVAYEAARWHLLPICRGVLRQNAMALPL